PKLFAIPLYYLTKPAHRELVQRAVGDRNVLPYSGPIRVRNPLLAHTYLSYEGLMRLRSVAKMTCKPGLKRYYLRRFRSTRVGGFGGVSEDPAFLEFLAKYGFETID